MATARRIVMFNQVTADGFFAGPDGQLDWIVHDDAVAKAGADAIPRFDTFLFGRRTYDMFESFWPRAAADPEGAGNPHAPGRASAQQRAFAVALTETPKIVFSKTRREVTWKNSRLVRALDPREIEAMKKQPGKDMMIFGSGSVVSALTRDGLIDEYQLVVSPVFIGTGESLLADLTKTARLELLEAKTFPTGNLMLRYAPSR